MSDFSQYTDNELIEELIERKVIEVCADDIFGVDDLIYVYRIDRLAAEEHERFA